MGHQKWVWQHDKYPNFPFQAEAIIADIEAVSFVSGRLREILLQIDPSNLLDLQIETIANEILSSNEIEGELLNRNSVISSVKKAIDPQFNLGQDTSTHNTDALVAVLLDGINNHEPLSVDRLHSWHAALFPTGYSGMVRINVGTFRSEEMQIIERPAGRQKVLYEAPPPQQQLGKQVSELIDYINHDDSHPYIKAAIAHLWFVVIHPYDDGNGRLSRVLSDHILSKHSSMTKYQSLSVAILGAKKDYYHILERSTNLFYNRHYDFTDYLKWHLHIHKQSIMSTIEKVGIVLEKTRLWDKINGVSLNERQKKVLNKYTTIGEKNFQGGLSTKKYKAIAKTSQATASRDLKDLVEKGILIQVKGTSGRSTQYQITPSGNIPSDFSDTGV